MVSQNVSQSDPKSDSHESRDTPKNLRNSDERLIPLRRSSSEGSTNSRTPATITPRGTKDSHRVNPGHIATSPSEPKEPTQRTAATETGRARKRAGSATGASPESTPNSHEEVSGMPIGNGCIFTTATKSGKKVWKVEVTVGYNYRGKRKRVRRTAHSHSDAVRLHRSMLSHLEQGKLGGQKSETLRDYGTWWLDNVIALRVRRSTASGYRYRLQRWVYPEIGSRRIGEITARDIEEWIAALSARGLSRSTVNGARQVLGALLGHAHRNGVIPANPAMMVQRLPRRSNERTQVREPWTRNEAQEALQRAKGGHLDLLLHLCLLFGLRRGEALGLRREDFDFPNGSLIIRRTIKEEYTLSADGSRHVHLSIDEPKTRASNRKLAVGPEVLAAIQRHRIHVEKLREQAGEHWQHSGYVFVSNRGTGVYPSNISKAFSSFLQREGLRRIRFHDMRHTAAVLGLEAGIRLEAVSQGLGHSRIDITKTVYAPYVQPLMTEFTSGLGAYLGTEENFEIGQEVNVR